MRILIFNIDSNVSHSLKKIVRTAFPNDLLRFKSISSELYHHTLMSDAPVRETIKVPSNNTHQVDSPLNNQILDRNSRNKHRNKDTQNKDTQNKNTTTNHDCNRVNETSLHCGHSYDVCLIDVSNTDLTVSTGVMSHFSTTESAIPTLFLARQEDYPVLKSLISPYSTQLANLTEMEPDLAEADANMLIQDCLPREPLTPREIKHRCSKLVLRKKQQRLTDALYSNSIPIPSSLGYKGARIKLPPTPDSHKTTEDTASATSKSSSKLSPKLSSKKQGAIKSINEAALGLSPPLAQANPLTQVSEQLHHYVNNLVGVAALLDNKPLSQVQKAYVSKILTNGQSVYRAIDSALTLAPSIQSNQVRNDTNKPKNASKAAKQAMQPSVRLTQDLGRQSEISTPQAIGFLQTTEPSFRVLVAEALDSHSQLLLLVEQLGYQANAVKDGAAVGQAMQQQHFDLLLLDTNLPNLTLFQAILNTDTGLMLEPQTGIAVFTWATDAPSNNTAKLNTEKTSPNQQPETNAFSPGQSPEPQLKLQACLSHPATLVHLHALLRTLEARHLQAFEQDPIVRQYQTILTRKLPDFLQRASRLILTIQNAVLHQDTQALGTAAHVLKGLAASFQFHQLSDTCERLEHMVELKTLSDSEAYMNQLYQQLSGLQPH